jgi:hypothetical protein
MKIFKQTLVFGLQAGAVLALATACGPEAAAPGKPVEAKSEVRGEPIAAAKPATNTVAAPTSITTGAKAEAAAAAGLIPTQALGNQVVADAPTNVEPGYKGVGFDLLAGYEFDLSDDLLLAPPDKVAEAAKKTNEQIPKKVHDLDGAKVAVKGFMLPLKVDADSGLVTEFLIMRDQSMCCYGAVPKINQWISVAMTGKGVRPMMDQPVTLYGKLQVGEMRENGYLVGIYKLDGDKLAGPQDM